MGGSNGAGPTEEEVGIGDQNGTSSTVGTSNTVQDGINLAKKVLKGAGDCWKLIAGDSRASGADDVIGALDDAGVKSENLGAASVSGPVVSYKLDNTTEGGIVLNSNFFPDPTIQNISVSDPSTGRVAAVSILNVVNQVYKATLSPTQFESLTILHELSHLLGRADDTGDATATKTFNSMIISNCLQ